MRLLHREVIVTRFLYALQVLLIAPSQRKKAQQVRRVSLRVWLRTPRFTTNRATLVKAQDSPLALQTEAHRHAHTRTHAPFALLHFISSIFLWHVDFPFCVVLDDLLNETPSLGVYSSYPTFQRHPCHDSQRHLGFAGLVPFSCIAL